MANESACHRITKKITKTALAAKPNGFISEYFLHTRDTGSFLSICELEFDLAAINCFIDHSWLMYAEIKCKYFINVVFELLFYNRQK